MRPKQRIFFPALACAFLVAPALAAFHLMKVVEVFPGTAAAPNAQYVVLQMYASGQNLVQGHVVTVFNAAGTQVGSFTFAADVSNSASQAKIFIATPEAAAFFGISADLVVSPAILSAGGKVCFETIDCVAWGSYSGSSAGVGTPYRVSGGLRSGRAAIRRLDIASPTTTLQAADDTDNCANDFLEGLPAPRNNASQAGTIPASTCGNAILEALEECDDGNLSNADTCSSTCLVTPAPPALSITDASISEGNAGTKQLNFAINLSPVAAGVVTFDVETDNGTAAPGLDFDSNSSLGMSIAAGQASANFAVTINGDNLVEGNETLTANLRNVSGANVGRAQALGTISNDDSATLSIDDVSLLEGNSGTSTARFRLHLSSPMPTPVAFDVATANGSATSGSDYIARNQAGRIIDPGRTGAVFEVSVSGDATAESDETFTASLSNVLGAAVADGSAIATIQNDDVALTPIAVVQGRGMGSPLVGNVVEIEGVVTARVSGGFFLQSLPPLADEDLATSEGVLVRSDIDVGVGDRVRASGRVLELAGKTAVVGAQQTALFAESLRILETGLPLPVPVSLNGKDFESGAAVGRLERLEGMRVAISAADVVGPWVPDAEDAGRHAKGSLAILPAGSGRLFKNFAGRVPLQVDAPGQRGGAVISADVGDRVDDWTGVLSQGDSAYRLLPDPGTSAPRKSFAQPRAVSGARLDEFAIGLLDVRDGPRAKLATRGSAEHALRITKLGNAICAWMRSPDIVAVAGLRDRAELDDLTASINAGDGNALFPGSCPGTVRYRSWLAAGAETTHASFLVREPAASSNRFDVRVQSLRALRRGATLVLQVQAAAGVAAPRRLQLEFDTGGEPLTALASASSAALWLSPLRTPGTRRSGREFEDAMQALPAQSRYSVIHEGIASAAHTISLTSGLVDEWRGFRLEAARINADFSADHGPDSALPLRAAQADPLVLYLSLR